MNLRLVLSAVVFGACVVGSPGHAQDLFLPVAGPEEAAVRAESSHYLAAQLYVTKRHRIVRINEDALRRGAGATIFANFFSDVQLQYTIDDPLELGTGYFDRVKLTLVNSGMVVQGFLQADPAMSQSTAQRLATGITQVSLSALLWVKDDLHGRHWPASVLQQPTAAGAIVTVADLRLALADEDLALGFSFSAIHPLTGARYSLRSLPANPSYHVLWEWDPARSNLKRTDSQSPPLSAEAKRRSEAYEQFQRSLGPVPGASTEMEDLERFRNHLKSRAESLPRKAAPITDTGEQP